MKLATRQNKKRNQALDAFASVAKTWSEWRLGEKATKTVAKGTKKASKSAARARKKAYRATKGADASSVTDAVKGTPLKVAGAIALVAGIGAAIAKKLKGGGTAEPLYTPPPAPAPMPPPADLKDVPPAPPTPVVVGDLGSDTSADDEPAPAGDDDAPAADAPADDDADSAEDGAGSAEDGADSAPAASEQAVAAAAEPAADATEPTVPDAEPDANEDDDITGMGDEGEAEAVAQTAVTPDDSDQLEAADDRDGDDDAPASPADEPADKS